MPLVVLDIDYRRVEREGAASDLFKARRHGRDRHSTNFILPRSRPYRIRRGLAYVASPSIQDCQEPANQKTARRRLRNRTGSGVLKIEVAAICNACERRLAEYAGARIRRELAQHYRRICRGKV